MDGKNLRDCHTLGSMWDQDSVAVSNGKEYLYRIKATDIQTLLKFFMFEEKKAKKYTYLINPKLKGGKNG